MSNLGLITFCAAVSGLALCAFVVWAYRREMSDLFFPRRGLPSLERAPTPAWELRDVSRPVWQRQASEAGEDLLRSAETAVEIELRLAESLDGAGEAASDAKRIRRRAMELAVILRRLRAQLSHG